MTSATIPATVKAATARATSQRRRIRMPKTSAINSYGAIRAETSEGANGLLRAADRPLFAMWPFRLRCLAGRTDLFRAAALPCHEGRCECTGPHARRLIETELGSDLVLEEGNLDHACVDHRCGNRRPGEDRRSDSAGHGHGVADLDERVRSLLAVQIDDGRQWSAAVVEIRDDVILHSVVAVEVEVFEHPGTVEVLPRDNTAQRRLTGG